MRAQQEESNRGGCWGRRGCGPRAGRPAVQMPREEGDRAATRAWGAGTRGSRMEGPAGGNMGLQVGMERVGRGALKGMGQGARGGVCGDIGAGVGLGGAPRGGGAPCGGDEPRGMRPLPGRPAEGTGEGSAGRPEGRPGTPLREVSVATLREVCEGRTAGTVAGGHTLSGGSPQGRLTRRTGRRPRCPRAPPRPGAARLPCSRGLGLRRGGSAISERTLCRRRAQPPLPAGGGGAQPLAAPLRVTPASGPARRAAEVPSHRTVFRSARPSRSLIDGGLRAPRQEAPPSFPRSGTVRLASAPRVPEPGRAEGVGSSTRPGGGGAGPAH